MSNYCCFLGHRKIKKTEELKKEIYKTLERLISCENVDTLLFGSKSEFNTLCHEIATELKKIPSHKTCICEGGISYNQQRI